ncbi:MAG: VTT domain-containing protein [Beijerinckiaceae bacterium]
MGIAWASGGADLLSPASLLSRRQELLAAADAAPVLAPVAFAVVYALVASLALPASAALTMIGGFLFGRWLGTGLVLIGATAGATAVFLVAQTAIGAPLRRRAGPLYQKLLTEAGSNGFNYMLFLRLMPLFPFPLVNLVAALLGVGTRTFVASTIIGIAPATFAYANFGQQIGTATSLGDVVSPGVLIALGAIGCLALVPIVYRRMRSATPASVVQE